MYKLIRTRKANNKFDTFNITVESDGDVTLPELSRMFRQFLEAVGYSYIEKVVFITDEGKEITEINCPTCHGKKQWVDIESRTITLCPDCNDLKPEQAKGE